MKELSLEEIKKIEFELLKIFDSFCKENHIQYFISNGTLLGAVKYKGFIPWDDDIDVLVPREDYNKLLALFKNSGRCHLFSFERNQKYLYPFAKLCCMDTKKEECNIRNGVELGVDIDIFPLDTWHPDHNKAEREVHRIRKKMFGLNMTKLRKPDSLHPMKRMIKGILMLFCKMLGSRFFIRSIIKESSDMHRASPYLGCKSWCIYGEREIIPASVFSDSVELEFEGEKFPAPIGYDVYLHSLYGDYEKDPPEEKRRSHHKFIAYRK